MNLTVASTRPILCWTWMLLTGGMMFYGLRYMGTANVIPEWWVIMGAGLLGWYYKDRSKLRSTQADSLKEGKDAS